MLCFTNRGLFLLIKRGSIYPIHHVREVFKYQRGPVVKERTVCWGGSSYWTSSGVVGLGLDSSGTGDVASMRAGLRMIGRDMGGTPTCRGEARGWRMRGDWPKGEAAWAGEVVNGTGMGEMEGGAGDDRPDPGKQENIGV